MENTSLFMLMSVVILSFLIPIIFHKLRFRFIPDVAIEIIVGIILGKSGFGYIQNDVWLNLLSTLGFMYLMFISGLEIDFNIFKSKKTNEVNLLKISISSFLLIFLVAGVFGFLFSVLGISSDRLFMTLLVSTVSLSIVVPTLKDRGIIPTAYGQTILLTTVISDFVTMILLGVYAAFHSGSMTKTLLLLVLFIVTFLFYRLTKRFNTLAIIEKISKESVPLGTRGIFGLIFFFVVLAQKVGTESILGAFLAGILVSLISPKKEFVEQLSSFGFGFLIPIFFVMVGANLELAGLLDRNVLLTTPLIIASFYLSKFIPILIWKRWFTWKETIGAGLLLPSTLSLIVAGTTIGVDLKVITSATQASLILSAVISCMISPILFQRFAPTGDSYSVKRVSLIGKNPITTVLAEDLSKSDFHVHVFPSGDNSKQSKHLLKSDHLLCLSDDEFHNIEMANWGREQQIPTVICRLINEENSKYLVEGVHIFSPYRSGRILLRALVEFPSLIKFLEAGQPLKEITLKNREFNKRLIKDLGLGNALIIRIFRGPDILVPTGFTRVQVGDILLISGDEHLLNEIKKKLSP